MITEWDISTLRKGAYLKCKCRGLIKISYKSLAWEKKEKKIVNILIYNFLNLVGFNNETLIYLNYFLFKLKYIN